jgi:hypothetical protein
VFKDKPYAFGLRGFTSDNAGLDLQWDPDLTQVYINFDLGTWKTAEYQYILVIDQPYSLIPYVEPIVIINNNSNSNNNTTLVPISP